VIIRDEKGPMRNFFCQSLKGRRIKDLRILRTSEMKMGSTRKSVARSTARMNKPSETSPADEPKAELKTRAVA